MLFLPGLGSQTELTVKWHRNSADDSRKEFPTDDFEVISALARCGATRRFYSRTIQQRQQCVNSLRIPVAHGCLREYLPKVRSAAVCWPLTTLTPAMSNPHYHSSATALEWNYPAGPTEGLDLDVTEHLMFAPGE